MRLRVPGFFRRGSLIDTLLTAIALLLSDFEHDIVAIKASINMLTARGFWLDFWGYMFRVDRYHREPDESYRNRILLVIHKKSTTRDAILSTTRLLSNTEPLLIEHNGMVLENADYAVVTQIMAFDGILPAECTFTRSSTAHLPNGTLVNVNSPRYIPRF